MEPKHPIEELIFAPLEALPSLVALAPEARDAVALGLESAAQNGTLTDALRTVVLIGAYFEQRGNVASRMGCTGWATRRPSFT